MKYALRDATPDDYETLFEITEGGFRQYVEQIWGWDETFQREYFREHARYDRMKIILVNGGVVGYFSARYDADMVFIESIVLLPAFRSKGIGTGIMKELISKVREMGAPLELQVFKANREAQRLYERLGFERCGETENHYKYRILPD